MKAFEARSVESSCLRQRKYQLVRQFDLPEDLIGGCLSQTHRRCGKPNCHCASGRGHPVWSVTFSRNGTRRVERVPADWLPEIEQAVLNSQAYLDAVKEVMAINLDLLEQTRCQRQAKKVREREKTTAEREKRSTLS
jgi:hypothetical protein